MPAASKPAPAPEVAPVTAAPAAPLSTGELVAQAIVSPTPPWWVIPWPNFLAVCLFGMVAWIMYILAPVRGHPPDELFKLLAQAIVLTGFIGGPVAVAYTMSQASKKQTDTIIAAQAATIAAQTQTPPAGA